MSVLVPGSLGLILSDLLPWASVFWIVAAFMVVGILTTLMIREVGDDALAPHTLADAVVKPFVEFFQRGGVRQGLAILAFMFLYKLGDNLATALATPFYIDMGYSNTEIGSVAKFAGLWAGIAGGVLGGIVMTAYMARETSRAFTATQFALFSSFIAVPRTFANASTGFIVEAVGWTQFYVLCALVAVPGLLLLLKVAPWNETPPHPPLATPVSAPRPWVLRSRPPGSRRAGWRAVSSSGVVPRRAAR